MGEILFSAKRRDTMKNPIVALALLALSTYVAGDCMICPGGSLRDYWILQLKVHEGYCEQIYEDSKGYLTFGIGHLITSSDPEYGEPCGTAVSESRVISAFDDDVAGFEDDYYNLYPDFDYQPDFVQSVVGDMMFNLGYAGLAEFENMKACVDAQAYDCAADEMEDSAWCRQVGRRCDKLSSMMREETAEHGYTEADINSSDCSVC